MVNHPSRKLTPIRRVIERVIRSFVLADEVERALQNEGYVIATPARLRREHDHGFAAGMAVCASVLTSVYGVHPGIKEALSGANLDTRQKMKAKGVDEYDLNILRPVFAELVKR
jgi:hypothetical protein